MFTLFYIDSIKEIIEMEKHENILRIEQLSGSDEDEVEDNMELDKDESDDVKEEPRTTGSKQKGKTQKKGIVYISSIPKHMNVAICRILMEQFGEIGRIFLQPDGKGSKFTSTSQNSSLSSSLT